MEPRRTFVGRVFRIRWALALIAGLLVLWLLLAWVLPVWRTQALASEIRAAGGECGVEAFLPRQVLRPVEMSFRRHCEWLTGSRIRRVRLALQEKNLPLLERAAERREMTTLDLAGGPLTPAIARKLQALENLQTVTLVDVKAAEGDLAGFLRHLPRLEVLAIDVADLSPETARAIAERSRLVQLRLQMGKVQKGGVAALSRSSSLETLFCWRVEFEDPDLSLLKDLPKLKNLALALSPPGKLDLRGMHALEHLNLEEARISDEMLPLLPPAEWIRLSSNSITDAGLQAFADPARAAALQEFDLRNTNISDKGLKHLHGCKHLRRVWTHGTGATRQGGDELDKAIGRRVFHDQIDF